MERNDSPFVFGNKKLPKTTAVLNICAAHICPSRLLGLCQLRDPDKECYALAEERRYRNTCLTSRMKMNEYWDRNSAWQIAQDLIALNETKRTKIKTLRINECGDFRHQADVEKAEMIARFLDDKDIRCYCYTARKDLDYSDVELLTVNGSGWMANNMFKILYEEGDFEYDYLCPGDCRVCRRCIMKGGTIIAVKKH